VFLQLFKILTPKYKMNYCFSLLLTARTSKDIFFKLKQNSGSLHALSGNPKLPLEKKS
jgi:hypothetical protein